MNPTLAGRTHIVIGDTQVKKGVPTAHLGWIGRYIVDKFAGRDCTIAHLGDHWDMPSLSSYDKGKKEMEGRRYRADVDAGNAGMVKLRAPFLEYNAARPARSRWAPFWEFFIGNHENRIARAVEDDPQLEGAIGFHDLDLTGWRVHPFLKVAKIDGVSYAHYFYHPSTSRAHGGANLDTRLKTIGHSFTMGHQQGKKYAEREVGPTRHIGLVNGSTYLHDEKYLGPQATKYWRGIVVCYHVSRGEYDAKFVSLDSLCRRYEGKTLSAFLNRRAS